MNDNIKKIKNISNAKKSLYMTAVFLLMVFCAAGCGNMSGKGTVIIADSEENADIYNIASSKESEVSNEQGYSGDNIEDKGELTEDSTTADIDKVYVYVCGHVMNPGVYELDANDRICDALNKAGGVLEDGRGEVLAQAMPVTDGMTVYVPGMDEDIEAIRNYEDGEGVSGNNDQDDLLSINEMTKEEWLTLPGIGEAKASAIIDYRKEHSQFKSIEELKDVPGIKDGVFNKIKDKIKV